MKAKGNSSLIIWSLLKYLKIGNFPNFEKIPLKSTYKNNKVSILGSFKEKHQFFNNIITKKTSYNFHTFTTFTKTYK